MAEVVEVGCVGGDAQVEGAEGEDEGLRGEGWGRRGERGGEGEAVVVVDESC